MLFSEKRCSSALPNVKAQFLKQKIEPKPRCSPQPPKPLPQIFSNFRKLAWMNSIKFTNIWTVAIWPHHGADVMREPADQVRWLWCGVQHQSFRSIVFEPDEVQKNQAEAHTSCQRLCFRFVPPIKQRPPNPWPANHAWALPNGRWQQVNETLKAMATCQRRPIIPISFCTDNNKIMPQLDHFHAPN